MDINGTPYFLLRGPADLAHRSSCFVWDHRRGALTLRQAQAPRLARIGPEAALTAWQGAAPLVRDPYGQLARLGPPPNPGDPAAPFWDRVQIHAGAGAGFEDLLDEELNRVAAPAGRFTDLALGGRGRLVAGYSDGAARHGLVLFDLGARWQTVLAPELPAAPVRAIVDADDQVWCLTADSLILCTGEPLPQPYQPLPGRFEPEAINPHPFAPVWTRPLPAGLAPLALCADAARLLLLVYAPAGAGQLGPQQVLTRPRDRNPAAPWTAWVLAPDCPPVLDLGVLPDGRLAAPAAREPGDTDYERRDCPVLELTEDPRTGARTAVLSPERFPQRSQHSPRLVGAVDGRVRYQAAPAGTGPNAAPQALPLLPLPRPVYPTVAQVTPLLGADGAGLDSGRPGTHWHRLYIDGCIPPGCRLTLMAKAFDDPAGRAKLPFVVQPAPLWSPLVSELPFHAGIAPSRPGESGLFEVLLQHAAGAVRTLTGRYLQLRIRMESDGRRTPAIHALRVYAPRFSYQEQYLPEFFRQHLARDDGGSAVTGPANGADVRERLLAAFEGMLTPIEGHIAAAEALLAPESAPLPILEGLAATLGTELPPGWPEARHRRLLAEGGLVQQWRGTYPGLLLALDIATGGAVASGQVVVVENFRLRRTFATILGLDLDDRDHPLTLGTGMNGNSIIGDSLILSDEDSRTFLALLAPELGSGLGQDTALSPEAVAALPPAQRADVETVRAFFDRYSHRVSVLLHGAARRERALVEEVLARELPAHLEWRIVETDHPFVLGLAPLLAVDSFLEETPPAARVTLDRTWLGREGLLKNPIALSPRAVNAAPT